MPVPLIPALILGFASFIASAFVILRIVVPVLPPHPLSRRVSPVAKLGIRTLPILSPADKGHLWLSSLDLIALVIFFWQIVNESTTGPSGLALAFDPGSAIRLWIATTIRQTCLLFVASATLLQVRMAQSVTFGSRQWMIWAPTTLIIAVSATTAGLLSVTGISSLFYGLTGYSVVTAILTSVSFGYLIHTLFAIKKNLAVVAGTNPWPSVREVEEKPRPSFATEEIDALRDGASWITSNASSRRNSMSTWSFTTHQTATTVAQQVRGLRTSKQSDMQIPPVPPLPSPYGPLSPVDSDPFRRDLPPFPDSQQQKPRMGSQSSWLTSSQGSHTTMTSWSYPTASHDGTVRLPSTQDYPTAYSPALDTVLTATQSMVAIHDLGAEGFPSSGMEVEKGLAALAPLGTSIEISMLPAYGWSVTIWLPLCFSLPYFILLSQGSTPSPVVEMLFVLSITLSSPLLAFNLLFGSPIPIPVGLFDLPPNLPVDPHRPLIHGSLPMPKISQEYKRSTSSLSVTVVEGRRSGDVWISKGDAVDGKGKLGRAFGMLSALPKLSVLPPEENHDECDMPPVPFRDDSLPVHVNGTPQSDNSVQFGRFRADSRANTRSSAADDSSLAFASRIMVAQRHYSALAQTVHVAALGTSVEEAREFPGDADIPLSVASGMTINKRVSQSSHLRSRSVTSTIPGTPTAQQRFSISPPPSFPLPPTPPSVRAARLAMLSHKKSFSSGQHCTLATIDDLNEIDAMTAGVLPLLVPGLTLGDDMKIKKDDYSQLGTYSKSKGRKIAKKLSEFGADFAPDDVHTIPSKELHERGRSGHKKNHFSLPSLSLPKGTMRSLASWSSEFRQGLENKVSQYATLSNNDVTGHRDTVSEVKPAVVNLRSINDEKERNSIPLARTTSTRSLGLHADVPHNVDTARSSVVSISNIPPSAASTITLFEDFEAGLLSEPLGESTPHQSTLTQGSRRQQSAMRQKRQSAIRYIKSDEEPRSDTRFIDQTTPEVATTPTTSSTWSLRSVKPLAQSTNRSARNSPDGILPKEGLRTLTLVKKHESLSEKTADISGTSSPSGIRPLNLGKRQRLRPVNRDENSNPVSTSATPRNKNFKELTLARSETSKIRGILRKTEILPDVVVRPPSLSERNSFTYNFRD
ncbi:hypothetical protein JR316_0004602 [Psilocybe cubensis]|uniref:Uncharacterized protein n=2 Tax=Psilocybe cubensis TaxID=181762 RepID=A0ACB8H4D5_PSICU|nr:hypothetical protein JR316_0004602 [Psilocybe cubensis]KAH9482502.1 hypothetical protein JR316_0004602 [Psilocybe cubensis]